MRKEEELKTAQINIRLSHSEVLTLKEVARELDFPPSTLARRIVKQYLRKHLEEKNKQTTVEVG